MGQKYAETPRRCQANRRHRRSGHHAGPQRHSQEAEECYVAKKTQAANERPIGENLQAAWALVANELCLGKKESELRVSAAHMAALAIPSGIVCHDSYCRTVYVFARHTWQLRRAKSLGHLSV